MGEADVMGRSGAGPRFAPVLVATCAGVAGAIYVSLAGYLAISVGLSVAILVLFFVFVLASARVAWQKFLLKDRGLQYTTMGDIHANAREGHRAGKEGGNLLLKVFATFRKVLGWPIVKTHHALAKYGTDRQLNLLRPYYITVAALPVIVGIAQVAHLGNVGIYASIGVIVATCSVFTVTNLAVLPNAAVAPMPTQCASVPEDISRVA